jgi:hypothetical protein
MVLASDLSVVQQASAAFRVVCVHAPHFVRLQRSVHRPQNSTLEWDQGTVAV